MWSIGKKNVFTFEFERIQGQVQPTVFNFNVQNVQSMFSTPTPSSTLQLKLQGAEVKKNRLLWLVSTPEVAEESRIQLAESPENKLDYIYPPEYCNCNESPNLPKLRWRFEFVMLYFCSIPLFQQKNFSVIRDRTQVSYDDKCLRTVAIQQTKLQWFF